MKNGRRAGQSDCVFIQTGWTAGYGQTVNFIDVPLFVSTLDTKVYLTSL